MVFTSAVADDMAPYWKQIDLAITINSIEGSQWIAYLGVCDVQLADQCALERAQSVFGKRGAPREGDAARERGDFPGPREVLGSLGLLGRVIHVTSHVLLVRGRRRIRIDLTVA